MPYDGLDDHAGKWRGEPKPRQVFHFGTENAEDSGGVAVLQCEAKLNS
jgi:hypothetical protein